MNHSPCSSSVTLQKRWDIWPWLCASWFLWLHCMPFWSTEATIGEKLLSVPPLQLISPCVIAEHWCKMLSLDSQGKHRRLRNAKWNILQFVAEPSWNADFCWASGGAFHDGFKAYSAYHNVCLQFCPLWSQIHVINISH